MSFIGQYEAKVDDKGRLVFPAGFKSLLPPGEGNQRFVIKKNIFEDCLEMYTCEEWASRILLSLSSMRQHQPSIPIAFASGLTTSR